MINIMEMHVVVRDSLGEEACLGSELLSIPEWGPISS